jgi:large subunit ribosomal protein L17
MRHRCRGAHLNKASDQRKALIRALTTALLKEGRITITKARAQAIRATTEKMIGLAKDGSLSARRQALGFIYDPTLVKNLFDLVPGRFANRPGGYTRIVRTVRRRGDGAEMAVIELVD